YLSLSLSNPILIFVLKSESEHLLSADTVMQEPSERRLSGVIQSSSTGVVWKAFI
ncbi:unnamed protein product, partial [Prunus brigantina]